MKNDNGPDKGRNMADLQGIPVSEVKKGFLGFYREAASGREIIAENKYSRKKVSLVSTDLLTELLDTLRFTLTEEYDDELGVFTISADEIPTYGEGRTREEAIESLLDGVVEFLGVYAGKIELFNQVGNNRQRALMMKLMRCEGDRAALRKALGL